MLVFGDRVWDLDPGETLLRLADRLRELGDAPGGIERHGRLVSLFIEASALAQGVADAAFARRGFDDTSRSQDALMSLLLTVARAVRRSWAGGFDQPLALPVDRMAGLARLDLPECVQARTAEGYAFYALYPEAYAAAAELLAPGAMKVIGIRSIGTGLAAMVAATTGADCPVTVRPIGHPFDRRVALSPCAAARLLGDRTARFAIVDEGPGLSGSSFGAVADLLEASGVAANRLHFFPSHAGDLGPRASPRHRALWARANRHVVDFDALAVTSAVPAHRLEHWVADLIGTCLEPIADISGGAWRSLCYGSEREWPAAHIQQERRKFLLRTTSGRWMLKFAGLGPAGARKLDRGRQLSAAGFTPEVVGYRHGFMIERWLDGARPLRVAGPQRARLVQQVGRYLAFRACRFEARPESGASARQLFEMARHNTAEAFSEDLARRLDGWISRLGRVESRIRRIETDNRMQAWEWRLGPDGRIVKTDALDHHDAHDLVGCQDVAWDVAGAMVELDLAATERDEILTIIERETGRGCDRELLAFLTPCYLAFQLGYCRLAAASLPGSPAEAARLDALGERYAERLRRNLSGDDGQPGMMAVSGRCSAGANIGA